MSERSSEDIIRMAQQQIAARKQQEREEQPACARPWRYAFVGLAAALLLGLLAWPGAPVN